MARKRKPAPALDPQFSFDSKDPIEIAADPAHFAMVYGDACGLIAVEELVVLYRETFPDGMITYEAMRDAAANRMVSWNGVSGIWNHDGVEFALGDAFTEAGNIEGLFYDYKHNCTDEDWFAAYRRDLPAHLDFIERERVRYLGLHERIGVRALSVEELTPDYWRRLTGLAAYADLIGVVLEELEKNTNEGRRSQAYYRKRDRFEIENNSWHYLYHVSQMSDGERDKLVPIAQAMTMYAFPIGGFYYDPVDDPPNPAVLAAVERYYESVPLWGLNGWSIRELYENRLPPVRRKTGITTELLQESSKIGASDEN